MTKQSRSEDTSQVVTTAYQQQAKSYDQTVRRFDFWRQFGFDLGGWRQQAIRALRLQPGMTVIDLGCGTGLNFPLLQREIGPTGTIIGIDLSQEMLDQARETAAARQWDNVHLVCADAGEFVYPGPVDAILSTYCLILVPEAARVIQRASQALRAGGRLAVLDMAWPRWMPLWWRHVLYFLRSYGVTADTLQRRPWEDVQNSMQTVCTEYFSRQFWFGFFYLVSGTGSG